MEQKKIDLQAAAVELSKANDLINAANNILQDLSKFIVEYEDDFPDKSFKLCQDYCALVEDMAAAIMKEAVVNVPSDNGNIVS